MNKSKQATLFQSWGKRKKEPETRADNPALASISHSICPESYSTVDPEIIDLCQAMEEDEDDEALLEALDDASTGQNGSSSYSNIGPAKCLTVGNKQDNNCDISHISIGAELLPTQLGYTQDNSLPGFDKAAGKLWIYPTNYPVREYQFNIVQQALFKNTLVVLPTGLGKTFIASVLMYNLYRWYPQGKVIFMAPTKPLVAQQIEACYKIMGIPQKDTAEMTGNMGPTKREKAWCENRVFFLTPQVMANDLSRGSCPAEKVKCLVVDEAHKALGNHAYCQVVRELVKYTQDFRVLALSATPGSDIKTVQQVINNLLISQIELRTEDSPDIRQYCHERKVEKIVIPLGDELSSVKATYIKILEVFVSRLKRQGVLYNRDTTSLSKFLILKARDAFRQNPPERLPRQQYGAVEGDFALAMSLYHGYELLQLHGARSLFMFLDGIVNGEKSYGRTRAELMRNLDFSDLLEMLAQKFTPAPSQRSSISGSASKEKKPFVTGHPKIEKLQEIVLDHFQNYANDENINKGVATRIMIFSQYRDSVREITDMLSQHYPLVKVMSFIGQSSAGKSTKGFTQKEQLKVMKQFREGGYNTLVSTCVGEEGLDIGEVDLIICFDAHKSPIRLVQRMGRTGRKREGRIVMLVTQGKEEQIYNQSQYSKRSIHKAILNGAKSLHFYQFNPRIVPDNTVPSCHKMHISVKEQFKPTRKLSADKDQCTNSIIGMKSRASSEEILTREEYEELVSEWGLPLDQVPKMPESSDIICLSAKQQEDVVEKENDSCRVLSLTEWLPWQNQLQPTHMIEHSLASKHLVELMEFIEIQPSQKLFNSQFQGRFIGTSHCKEVASMPILSGISRCNKVTRTLIPEESQVLSSLRKLPIHLLKHFLV
ncbi:hypothetical protein CHS0354_038942 [Potamilus streckersoni]|uniref:Fanconi anemia group M protein n=1 Tax=Potamilus streckersoni TaxID=2493646 RepID=A0AAE0S126_9BIVA|nr:hypothetical protein CHS0354_038942 [Potamilus streckersoni]